MKTVLHYKTKYLNLSETFIDRVVNTHKAFQPVIATVLPVCYTDGLTVESPLGRIAYFRNLLAFKLNLCPEVVYRAIRNHNPSVIHAHFGIDGYRLHRLAATHNIPIIVSFYGSDVVRLYNEFGWTARLKKLANANIHFTSPTKYMKRDLVARGFPEERITVVHFGIDLTDMSFRPRKDTFHSMMMVGRLVEKKGFEFGLNAFNRIHEAHPKLTLDIYGDGPLRHNLSMLAVELGIAEKVTFHGSVPNSVVRDALYIHDALLVPSVTARDGDTEGLPNTILESMACGTPVLSTRHVGIPEAVIDQQTGWLSDERDDIALSENMMDAILNYEKRLRIAVNARKLVESEYHIESVTRKLEALYDDEILAVRSTTRIKT